MPPEHLAAPSASQANEIIGMKGSPDRDGGCPLASRFKCRCAEAGDDLMHRRDQRPELVEPDLVVTGIQRTILEVRARLTDTDDNSSGILALRVGSAKYHTRLKLRR